MNKIAAGLLTLLCCTVDVLVSAPLDARELPVRSFTTADGLSDNRVHRIVLDSRGLLWVLTASGISRFDGSHFQNFDDEPVMGLASINDLLETSDGGFWLATNGAGVIRFPLSSRGRGSETFLVSPEPASNRINRLYRGPDGTIWAGTDGGLFRMTVRADGAPVFARVPLRLRGHSESTVQIWALEWDAEGTLWVGTRFGLVRVLLDGRLISYAVRTGLETDQVFSILYNAGLLWIGHQSGLTIFKPPPVASESPDHSSNPEENLTLVRAGPPRSIRLADVALPHQDGESMHLDVALPGESPRVNALVQAGADTIYVIAADAIVEFSNGRFTVLSDTRFRAALMGAATEDREGSLWIATQAGALRVARQGFNTFGVLDGIGPLVPRVFVSRAGDAIAISDGWRVSRFDGERFHTVRANLPAFVTAAGLPSTQGVIEDRKGDWWFATGAGLFRFAGVQRLDDLATRTPQRYSSRDGLAQDDIRSLFEDSRGGIWIAGLIPSHEVLTRWDRATGRFRTYSDADGLQAFNSPTGFYEDVQGAIWIAFRDGGIARYDKDTDRFRLLSEANGLPAGNINSMWADHAGRLWCSGTPAGLYRIDNLNAGLLQPDVVATPAQLAGQKTSLVIEDALGRMYLVTARGIMRFDETGAGRDAAWHIAGRYSPDDGLAMGTVLSAARDRQGRLWFSTTRGVSYFQPRIREAPLPPQIRIGGLRIGGVEQPLSAVGEERIADLELLPGQSQLEVDFFGISFAAAESLTYEYRLLGADEAWSVPRPATSVLFSNLAPGSYEFEVRAVSASGQRGPQTARATFRVMPPVWRRWWFVTLAAVFVLGSLASFERYRAAHAREISRGREERLAELEQVRKRIAADLHDEIGSSLTQISILSEVALREGADASPELSRPLSTIASSSRELIDSMSDIVWAINPDKDQLSDLTQRMRRYAADAFTASNTAFQLALPASDREISLGANVRREVFLIFKEAVTNIVKHAAGSEAFVALSIEGGVLRLDVRDNGNGFDPHTPSDGHGLESLRGRAAAIGGRLTVVTAPGSGTAIALHLPIAP
jgi:signal transduction histidine kinase/ligand-binding sensor domain-containing protein